jgi:hypothetical protein
MLESSGVAVEVFEPAGEVELSGGEVAGGDEAENGALDVGWEFGEGVAGAGASEGVEFVESEAIVECEKWRVGEAANLAVAGCKVGVDVGCEVLRVGPENERYDGLQGGELRGAQVLSDVDGAVVDELLETKARSGLGGAVLRSGVQMFRADGHDTTLLKVRYSLACVRVPIGRRKGEEKSRWRCEDSPPKVVCRARWFCGYVDNWALTSSAVTIVRT